MPKARNRPMVFPPNSDHKLLARYHKTLDELRNQRFKESHERFARTASLRSEAMSDMAKAAGAKRVEESQRDAAKRAARLKTFHRFMPKPRQTHPRGHNPLVFPPYQFAAARQTGFGMVDWEPWHGGPDVAGNTGGKLALFQSSQSTSGATSAQTAVGFWYYAQASGMLNVTAYTFVSGGYYFYAPAWFLLASGRAAVSVWISDPAVVNWQGGTSELFNRVVLGGSDYSYDLAESTNATVSMLVQAGNWYFIEAGTEQSAFAMPDCDADTNAYTFVEFFGYYLQT